jgi:hypothetical protein
MTATVTDDLVTLLDAYRTCEFLTVSRDGTPIAWPTISLFQPEDGTILVTTSIALPQKAYNVRRDPRVALLFSDPTASGLEAPDQVLVQGTASCPNEIITSLGPRERLWRRIYERQPSSRQYASTGLGRYLFDWYYMRLLITTTPATVRTRPPLDASGPLDPPPAALRPTVGRLPEFSSAVLAAFDTDGRPTLLRTRPTAESGSLVVAADGEPLRPGPASLLCHSHDEKLWTLRSFVATGDLAQGADGGWRFTPRRHIPGGTRMGPLRMIRTIRQLRSTAAGYLDRRGLARPLISWDEYRPL